GSLASGGPSASRNLSQPPTGCGASSSTARIVEPSCHRRKRSPATPEVVPRHIAGARDVPRLPPLSDPPTPVIAAGASASVQLGGSLASARWPAARWRIACVQEGVMAAPRFASSPRSWGTGGEGVEEEGRH